MAVREELVLDLSRALSQIDDLERELDSLLQPIEIPVQLEADQALDQLRREIRLADTDDIDIDVDSTDLDRAEQELEEMRREANRAEDAVDDLGDEARRSGDDVERLGRRGSGAFRSLGANVGLLLSGVAAFAGAREIFEFFGESIEAASDLEESLSKTRVVFGEFSDDIETFAREAPGALLLSEQAALEATATFGNLFTALGLSRKAAADLSPDIVQLGADLASFNNIEVDEALTALRSGLVGEVEPLRRLGVAINAATVEAKALELGLVGANGEVTEAAKVQARWALILEQTSNAQGDVARTADSIANRQRNVAAEFQTLQATIGEALIPAFEAILDAAPAVLEGLEAFVPVLEDIANGIAGIDFAGLIQNARIFFGAIEALGELRFDEFNLFVDLEQQLDSAESPAIALRTVLEQIADTDLSGVNLEKVTDELISIANLDPSALLDLLGFFINLGPALGLSEEQLQVIVGGLKEAAVAASDVDEATRRGAGRNFLGRSPEEIRAEAEALEVLSGAIGDFDTGVLLEVDLQANIASEVAEITAQVNQIPDAFDAAREAIRDEENQIIDDFSEFFDNLEDELAARQAFAENLDILRSLGFDDLADQFANLGIESAAALADGLENPAELARAEAALDDFNARINDSFITNIAAAVAEGTENIDDLIAAIQAVNGLTSEARIQVLFEAIGAIDSRSVFESNIGTPSVPVSQTRSSVDITINQGPSEDPGTTAARTAQAVSAAISSGPQ